MFLVIQMGQLSSSGSTSLVYHPFMVGKNYFLLHLLQSMLLLDAFNKDRASLPQPLANPPILAPVPVPPPDARTQEMINEKLKKAEDLGECRI